MNGTSTQRAIATVRGLDAEHDDGPMFSVTGTQLAIMAPALADALEIATAALRELHTRAAEAADDWEDTAADPHVVAGFRDLAAWVVKDLAAIDAALAGEA